MISSLLAICGVGVYIYGSCGVVVYIYGSCGVGVYIYGSCGVGVYIYGSCGVGVYIYGSCGVGMMGRSITREWEWLIMTDQIFDACLHVSHECETLPESSEKSLVVLFLFICGREGNMCL